MKLQTLANRINEESIYSNELDDRNLSVWSVEIYDEDYKDWQSFFDLIIDDDNDSLHQEVISELNCVHRNEPIKVRIFDREYAELINENGEVMMGDLGSGSGCSDYYYQNGKLEYTEDFVDF